MRKLTVLLAAGLVFGASGMAMAAGTGTGTMTVSADLTDSCTVSASTMNFGSIVALASTAPVTQSSSSLQIACTSGTTPMIWSDTERTLVNGINSFAFNLSQTAGAASDDLPLLTASAEAIGSGFIADGSLKNVTIYGKVLPTAFGSKPSGAYARAVTVKVNY